MLLKFVILKSVLQLSFVVCLEMEIDESCPENCQCDGMARCLIFHGSQRITCPPLWRRSSIIVNFNLSTDVVMDKLFVNCSNSSITAIMMNMGNVRKITSSFLTDIIHLERLIINGPGFVDYLDNNLFVHSMLLKVFKMSGHNLSMISNNMFFYCLNLQQLYLPGNRIKMISNLSFETCKNVKIIDLSRNIIQGIHRNTFQGLISLFKLILSHNRISFIEGLAFRSFENIHTIDLSYNQLMSIDIRTFFQIPTLFTLFLNDNQIAVISIRAFKGLMKLNHLNLRNNNLKWLDEAIFEEMGQLNILELDSTIDCINKMKKSRVSEEVRLYFSQYPSCLKEETVTQGSAFSPVLDIKLQSSTQPSHKSDNYVKDQDRYGKVSNTLNKTCFNCTVSLSCASSHIWISFLAGVMTLSCFVLVIGFVIYVLITQRIIHNLRQYRANQDCLSMVTTNTRESNMFPQSKCEYKSINGIMDCDIAL